MKKIRFFTACFLALLCQTFLFANTSTFNQGNFVISMNDEITEITINGIIDCPYDGNVEIPAEFDGIPVTVINSGAFKYKNMKSVSIPSSVRKIGYQAFYDCDRIVSIIIPDSVTEIGSRVFYSCTSLKNISLPKNLKSIGSNSFESCKALTNPDIPASVTKVGTGLFSGCNTITLAHKISVARRFNTDIF